jgi:hypothetical protein
MHRPGREPRISLAKNCRVSCVIYSIFLDPAAEWLCSNEVRFLAQMDVQKCGNFTFIHVGDIARKRAFEHANP